MKLKNYPTTRYNDFGWGMNTRDSEDFIEDKQGVLLKNFQCEGNKLVTIKGYEELVSKWNGNIKGISSWDKYVTYIWGTSLYVYNTNTWTEVSVSIGTSWASTLYNINVGKVLDTFIVITDTLWVEDMRMYRYNGTTLTSQAFTWLSNLKFTCCSFMGTQLWAWGNILAPNVLYASRLAWPLNESNIYNFTYAVAQYAIADPIGDVNPISWFIENGWYKYIAKTNWMFRVTEITVPTTTSWAWVVHDKVTSTWPINQQVLQSIDQDVMYFDWRNVRRLSYEVDTSALKDSATSSEISTYINSLPEEQPQATAWFIYPYYKLFLKDRFSSTNNIGLVYNVREKSWSTQFWMFPSVGTNSYWNNKRVAYFGLWIAWGQIFRDNTWISFWGSDVNYTYLSKKYAFGDNLDYKRLWEIEIFGKVSSWISVYIDVILDSKVIDTREIFFENTITSTLWSSTVWVTTLGWVETTTNLNDYRYRYEYFNDWVFLQFRIRATWTWYFELHWMNVESKYVKAFPIHY